MSAVPPLGVSLTQLPFPCTGMAPGGLEKLPPAFSLTVYYSAKRNYFPVLNNKDFLPRAAALAAELLIYYVLREHLSDRSQADNFDPFERFN